MNRLRTRYERYVLLSALLSGGLHLLLAFTPASFGAYVFGIDNRPPRPRPSLELIELAPEPVPEYVPAPPAPPSPGGSKVIAPPPPRPQLSALEGDTSPVTPLAVSPLPGPAPALDLPLSPTDLPAEDGAQLAADSTRALETYLAQVFARIERERRYPETCRRMGQQGEVGLSFAIEPDGGLTGEVQLEAPCRFGALNRSAVESVRRAAPFPPLPDYVHAALLSLSLRVRFSLQD